MEEPTPHHTFSRGNCSAYGAAAKKNENWTTISNKTERRRVQNRIAQRKYRRKLKDRLQLLEQRTAQLSSLASSSEPRQTTFNDEGCHPYMPSNASTSLEEHCHHCSHCHATSRHTTVSPPTSYSSYTTSLTHSPNMHYQRQDMLSYYQDMQRQYPIYHTSEPLQMALSFTTEAPQDLELNVSYLQSYVDDIPTMKFEYDGLPSPFMNC